MDIPKNNEQANQTETTYEEKRKCAFCGQRLGLRKAQMLLSIGDKGAFSQNDILVCGRCEQKYSYNHAERYDRKE